MWLYHRGGGGLAGIWSSVQWVRHSLSSQINHLSSATVETFILDPRSGLPVGPPFQCSAVMLFNWKHNNNSYYLRQRNRHLQVSTATSCHLPGAGGIFFVLSPCRGGKNRTAGTYHGETWCRPCACGKTTSCAELLCHSKHPRWWGRGFPHCYSQRLPLQETPVRGWRGYNAKLNIPLPKG